jgi:hypothetical protein
MFELPEAWLPLVNALIQAPVAWRSPADLADALHRDVDETTDLLCSLDIAGWVDVWECDPGPLVTLSALAAERLHVHLVEVGSDEIPRWARTGDPTPPHPKAKHVCISESASSLAFVIDPQSPPDLAAEQAENAASIASALQDGSVRTVKIHELPKPTMLIGQGLSPWPGPDRDPRVPCPACGGNRLDPNEYCLCCDSWGMDGKILLDPASRVLLRSRSLPVSSQEKARRDQIQAESDRNRRKARRKARNQARTDAESRSRKDSTTKVLKASPPQEPEPVQDSASSPLPDSARALR